MKKFLVVFGMFFTFTSYANNSVSENEIEFKTNSLNVKINKQIEENFDDLGWLSTCYVTIVNFETGATRKVNAIGYGETQSDALANCGANATVLAHSLVDTLNNP